MKSQLIYQGFLTVCLVISLNSLVLLGQSVDFTILSRDTNGNAVANVEIVLLSTNGLQDTLITDSAGILKVELDCRTGYTIIARSRNHLREKVGIHQPCEEPTNTIQFSLISAIIKHNENYND